MKRNITLAITADTLQFLSSLEASKNKRDANPLKKQWKQFSRFAEKAASMVKGPIAEGAIYPQFCPMAFEGKGGHWPSNVEEINDPYYGDKMPKCGKVTETL